MAASAISAAGFHAANKQAAQSLGQHKHGGGHHVMSISDIDQIGSSVATAPSSSGKIGSRVNITA